ncbi:MAG: hypothetical protein GY761_15370 [Hyphomicrobiales bacterium]|nr:hypothetical protein [Hyphomicrobiales bacterium]
MHKLPTIGEYSLAKGTTLSCENIRDIDQFMQNQTLLCILEQTLRPLSMEYEMFDAQYWFTQLNAERRAMPWHLASFAMMLYWASNGSVFIESALVVCWLEIR